MLPHPLRLRYNAATENGSTAIDWSRPVGTEGPVLKQKEIEIRVSARRLSQFLHREQGALVVCGT